MSPMYHIRKMIKMLDTVNEICERNPESELAQEIKKEVWHYTGKKSNYRDQIMDGVKALYWFAGVQYVDESRYETAENALDWLAYLPRYEDDYLEDLPDCRAHTMNLGGH